MGNYTEIVGLLPAAGQATRIAPLPCSKELYPIGFHHKDHPNDLRPKVVCHYLLERMQLAGVERAYIIIRKGKWDIPAYLGDGSTVDLPLGYLMMNLPFGAPYTLDQAYPFVKDALVVFGFPDIIFQPKDAFTQLIARQEATKADLVLGLFPVDKPQKMDMIELDLEGTVRNIVIKPHRTHLEYTWLIAVWTPVFTRFLHEYLAKIQAGRSQNDDSQGFDKPQELFVGHIIQAAIDRGVGVEKVIFSDGNYIDIGTPEDLVKAVSRMGRSV